jgi:hypothetical protein
MNTITHYPAIITTPLILRSVYRKIKDSPDGNMNSQKKETIFQKIVALAVIFNLKKRVVVTETREFYIKI